MVSDEVFRRDAGIRIFQMRNPKVRVYSENYEKIGLCSWLEDLGAFPVDNLQLDPRRKWDFGDRKWRECTCLLETSDLDDRIKCLERINIMLFAAAGGEQEVITNYLQQICEAEIKTAKAIRDGYNPDEVYENFCSSLISGPSLVVNELIRLARTRGVGFVLRVERVNTSDQAADMLTKGRHGRVEWSRLTGLAGMSRYDRCEIALRKGA